MGIEVSSKNVSDCISEAIEAMQSNGMRPPSGTLELNKMIRFNVNNKKSDKDYWYWFSFDGGVLFGAFGCWKSSVGIDKVSFASKLYHQLSDVQKHEINRRIEEQKKESERLKIKGYEAVAVEAQQIIVRESLNQYHQYALNKGVSLHHDIRVIDNVLFVPLYDVYGKVWSCQRIYFDNDGNCQKRYFKCGRKKGLFYRIKGNDDAVLICEGYATGATLYECTGCTVICAMDTHNIVEVVKELKKDSHFVKSHMIICADHDYSDKPEVQSKIDSTLADWRKIADVVTPPRGVISGYDFNDYHRDGGNVKDWVFPAKFVDDADAENKIDDYIALIDGVLDIKTIELDIVNKIKCENFSDVNLEILTKKIQLKIKEITGASVAISKVRKMIEVDKVVNGTFIENDTVPEWCNDWIYVSVLNSFFNLKTYKLKSTSAFNLICGVNVPCRDDSESKPYAVKYVSDNGFIEEVDASVYMPSNEKTLVMIDDTRYVNTFNKNSVPMTASNYSESGLKAIEMVKNHIDFLCNNDTNNTNIFMQWIAHNVQFMGKKILWSPVLQGIQGIGKTAVSEMIKACIGDNNVGIVSPNQVVSDFNPWASNKCVNVLEELRIAGKNRHDCVNALKPLITDRMIQINSKGANQYTTYNTTNYICFTNYKDAIPIDEGDRRWWIVFTDINHISEMIDKVGMQSSDYFALLFDNIAKHGEEIRKFFLEYEISEEFLNMKTAPMTDYKKIMVSSENSKHEGLEEIKELIERGGEFYNNIAVCPAELFADLFNEHEDLEINKNNRNYLLLRLGYLNLGKTFKIKGKVQRVWAKKPMDNSEVQNLFKDKHGLFNAEFEKKYLNKKGKIFNSLEETFD